MKELLKFKTFTAPMEGVSQSTGNPWRKITAIFETLGDRPHDIAFSALNDTCNRVAELKPGMVYEVNFDLNSREYNGKWYTDAKAWAIIEPNAFDNMPQQPAEAVIGYLYLTGETDRLKELFELMEKI